MSSDAIGSVVNSPTDCPYCAADSTRIAHSSSSALVLWDAFPVSRAHALVVPRRHVPSWSNLTSDEKSDIIACIDTIRSVIDARYHPDGYNIGCNDGVPAGQTILHFHMHVIPRYRGDAEDPRGGIRWVLPDKADYWRSGRQ
jgi:diadenosine tetraphosphate (Ap4A) HIT family hydrolase